MPATAQPATPRPAAPLPDAEELRDNASFEAILGALSRPGTLHALPEPGLLPVALALLDRECRFAADDPVLAARLALTGAQPVPLARADHAFLDLSDAPDRLATLPAGSQLYPDQGATVIAAARLGEGPELELTGPGIRDTARIRLGGLAPGLWAARARLCRYPEGIEMILVDGPRLLAIPRSTTVREL